MKKTLKLLILLIPIGITGYLLFSRSWASVELMAALAMSLGYFALELAAPKRLIAENSFVGRLWMQACAIVCLWAPDIRVVFVAWSVLPAPLFFRRRASPAYMMIQIFAAVIFGGAVGYLTWVDPTSWAAGILICFAAFLRQGLFPFQSAVIGMGEGLAIELFVGFLISQSGIVVLFRFALPLMTTLIATHHWGLVWLGLMGATYAALLALGRKTLRRFLSSVALFQSSLVLVGLAAGTSSGCLGAFMQWITSILVLSGLGIAVWTVKSRTGYSEASDAGGLQQTMPVLGAAFLALGLAAIGLPSTLGAVGEDLLINLLLNHSFLYGGFVLMAVATMSIAMLRTYQGFFLGPLKRDLSVPDVRLNERVALFLPLVVLIVMGFFPNPMLSKLTQESKDIGGMLDPSGRETSTHEQNR